jgi:molybdopterin-guanine dinucleotide biosynthesis protein A
MLFCRTVTDFAETSSMDQKPSRAAFILTGGRSSRMGTDKALLNFGAQTLIERALTVVATVCTQVAIVGDPAKFSCCGTVIEDVYRGAGPLAGIHAALLQSSAELNLMLAVDMPFVSQALLEFLFACAAGTGALVTVPRTGRGFQPLCAVYRTDFATAAERALRAGKNKIDAVFAGLPIRVVEDNELEAAGFSVRLFLNVNTPEDLRTAQSGSL